MFEFFGTAFFIMYAVMFIIAIIIGSQKGHTFVGAVFGFLLGPLGVLLLLAIPASNRKPCPLCRELIYKDAIRCPRCTSDLSAPPAVTRHGREP